ncbi:MAG: LicD family protein [Solobacterium sp.]|nr:LicD family protein [Solobacterium sp.]
MIKEKDVLREVQLCNLKNLKKLDEICRKYELQYWIAYGSLIGTVRHKGFIPWDDDIDVIMMREDYLKLCKVPAEEWGDECMFCDAYSDDERQDKVFGRVFQKNTRIQSYKDVQNWRSRKNGKPWYSAVMLDIFIIEQLPDDEKELQDMYDKMKKLRNEYKPLKLKWVSGDRSIKGRAKELLKERKAQAAYKHSERPWADVIDEARKLIENSNKGDRFGFYCTYDPYIYQESDFFPVKYMDYEDMKVPVPNNYDKLLTDMYGDYMTYPPEAERYHINFIYLDFGDGREYVIDPVKGSLGEGKQPN